MILAFSQVLAFSKVTENYRAVNFNFYTFRLVSLAKSLISK